MNEELDTSFVKAERQAMELTDDIIAYESGELEYGDIVRLFADLIRTGLAWSLQGSYGRQAHAFINDGIINRDGVIDEGFAAGFYEEEEEEEEEEE